MKTYLPVRGTQTDRNGDTMEIDILAINGQYAVTREAISSLRIDDVKKRVDRLKQFKRYFPEYTFISIGTTLNTGYAIPKPPSSL